MRLQNTKLEWAYSFPITNFLTFAVVINHGETAHVESKFGKLHAHLTTETEARELYGWLSMLEIQTTGNAVRDEQQSWEAIQLYIKLNDLKK